MNMRLAEAVALRQRHLHGDEVDSDLLRRALQRINLGNTIAAGRSDTWKPEALTEVQRERANQILVFKLALACGKFDDWRAEE